MSSHPAFQRVVVAKVKIASLAQQLFVFGSKLVPNTNHPGQLGARLLIRCISCGSFTPPGAMAIEANDARWRDWRGRSCFGLMMLFHRCNSPVHSANAYR